MESKNKEFTYLVIAVVIIVLAWIFYNFLSKIKSADITLVPAGSQAAVNPYTGAPSTINSPQTNNSGSITNAGGSYYDVMNNQMAAYGIMGGAMGSFAGAYLP